MFEFAFLIGIFGYLIFDLGLIGALFWPELVLLSFSFGISLIFLFKYKVGSLKKFNLKRLGKIDFIVLLFFISQIFINFVGAISPELSFDALWYHLTFPKLYLIYHSIFYIPGGLLYYSTIPKFIELLFIPGLSLGNEIIPKLIQFLFGILISFSIFKVSRKYLGFTVSLFAAALFYSNLVVAWESTVAYIDLGRAFFEIISLWGYLNFIETKEKKWFYTSAIMLGLSISSKLLSLVTIPIFAFLIFLENSEFKIKIKLTLTFTLITIFIASPWFIFSFIHTGNPIYPLLSNYDTHQGVFLLNPITFFKDMLHLFTRSSDPLSPFYLISLSLIIYYLKQINLKLKVIFIYSMLSIFAWYFSPQAGEGRYFLAYLPALSILSASTLEFIKNSKAKNIVLAILIMILFITPFYRGIASLRYFKYLLGSSTKQVFLTNNLNFSFGDFYDTDSYFKNHIKTSDKVLLYGFHNLYYIDFPFVDSSFVKKGDMFNFIATQNSLLPEKYKNWILVYSNPKTHVNLYSKEGRWEEY